MWRTGEPLNAQEFEGPVAEFERVAVTPPATALPSPFAEPVTPSPVAKSSTPRRYLLKLRMLSCRVGDQQDREDL